MQALIENLIPVIENKKTVGLRLDVENATDLEINVYVLTCKTESILIM